MNDQSRAQDDRRMSHTDSPATTSPGLPAGRSQFPRVSFIRNHTWLWPTVAAILTLIAVLAVELDFASRRHLRLEPIGILVHLMLAVQVLIGVVRLWTGGRCTIDPEAGVIEDNGGTVLLAHVASPRVFDTFDFDDTGRRVRKKGIAVNTRQNILEGAQMSTRRLRRIAQLLRKVADEYWERRRQAATPEDGTLEAALAQRELEIAAMLANTEHE